LYCARLSDGPDVLAQALVEPIGAGRWSLFTPAQAPLSLMVFDRKLGGQRALQSLLGRLPGWGLLLNIPAEDKPFSALTEAPSPALASEELGVTISIATPEGFEAYWGARSRDLKQNIRRYIKRAGEEGLAPDLRCIREPAEIGLAVDRFGSIESVGWKGREGTALHPDNPQGRFYRELLQEMAARGRARAYELYLGKELAASRLLVSAASMHVMLKTTYKEEYKRLAAGRLLMYLTLQDLLNEDSTRTIEFYTRANEDMLAWATHTRAMANVTLYRSPLLRRIAAMKARLRKSA
jgi:hypothetical protein